MSLNVPFNNGGWLPASPDIIKDWIHKKLTEIGPYNPDDPPAWAAVIQDFQSLIEGDPQIYMDFVEMFKHIGDDEKGRKQITDYNTMLMLFDSIIKSAPPYDGGGTHIIGVPVYAVLCFVMNTREGYSAFANPKVNAQFHNMFEAWAALLSSPKSRSVLTTNPQGWFSADAMQAMPDFVQTYVCNPAEESYGFKCWDDFFTRPFRPGMRPVINADDDSIVTNACESTFYRWGEAIGDRSKFWLKSSQPYSILHMLNNDPLATQFADGKVYQAFLSPQNYHCWHSPVNGKVVKTVYVPGTYFAVDPYDTEPAIDTLTRSQPFLSAVAARGLVFIESDNPNIGLMCFIAVGMVEVSTIDFTVQKGDRVKKGDELGKFHFGGSTHCLVFRKETKITFAFDNDKDSGKKLVLLNQEIGRVAAN